jgi:hypothetical protein
MYRSIGVRVKNLANAEIASVSNINITYTYLNLPQNELLIPSIREAPAFTLNSLPCRKPAAISTQLDENPLLFSVSLIEQKSMSRKYVRVEESMHTSDPDLDFKFVDAETQEQMLEMVRVSFAGV